MLIICPSNCESETDGFLVDSLKSASILNGCELEANGFTLGSFSIARTVKHCEYAADSPFVEGVISSDNSELLLGADNVSLVSREPLECPGIKPLWAVLDSGTEIAEGFDALFMTTPFGERTGAIVVG